MNKINYSRNWKPERLGLALSALLIVTCSGAPPTQANSTTTLADLPQYTADNRLVRPGGTDKWVFVGSSLGLSYTHSSPAGQPQFHNVYITATAFDHYRTTGEFPDKTMLLLDRYLSAEKSAEPATGKSALTRGSFNGSRSGFEVAVKNQQRPDRRAGSNAVWAYYAFASDSTDTAVAFNDSACQSCHEKNASEDHVWVQFYPVLRRLSRVNYSR